MLRCIALRELGNVLQPQHWHFHDIITILRWARKFWASLSGICSLGILRLWSDSLGLCLGWSETTPSRVWPFGLGVAV